MHKLNYQLELYLKSSVEGLLKDGDPLKEITGYL